MNLTSIINDLANQADDYLEGATSREQARAAVSEMITLHYATLSPADRSRVIDGVMRVLEEEDFFNGIGSGGSSDDDADDSED